MPEDFGLIVAEATEQNPRNTEGDIVVLADGRLLLAWSDFYGGPADNAPARISAKVSGDGGRTWGERYTLQENVGDENVMSVSLLRLDSGEILFVYGVKNSTSDLQFYGRLSRDEATTWSDPVRITDGRGYHIIMNARLLQLPSGLLMAPICWRDEVWTEGSSGVASAFVSDDRGRSWMRSEASIPLPKRGAMEPGVVRLRDGTRLMIIRTQLGQIYRSLSFDEGATWTPGEPMGVRAPEAPSTIARIPATNDLLLIWNDTFAPGTDHGGIRTPLVSAVSGDEGRTWRHRRVLEDAPHCGFAYTSVTFHQGRALLTYWVRQRFAEPRLIHLKLRSVTIEWFYHSQADVAPA
ncbi:MAG: sialidase family protein [Armatimonadota bacterium]|nr:sialidase family protein [Armatimonadota bacterium]